MPKHPQPWSDDEVEYLKAHFVTAPREVLLARFPHRTWSGLRDKAHKGLGLNRPHVMAAKFLILSHEQQEAILDAWKDGLGRVQIATRLGLPLTPQYLTRISTYVDKARHRGDPRANRKRGEPVIDASSIKEATDCGIPIVSRLKRDYDNFFGDERMVRVSLPRLRCLEGDAA